MSSMVIVNVINWGVGVCSNSIMFMQKCLKIGQLVEMLKLVNTNTHPRRRYGDHKSLSPPLGSEAERM